MEIKKFFLIILLLLSFVPSVLLSEVIDLDTFLKKTLTYFREKELNDEFLQIRKDEIYADTSPKFTISNEISKQKDYQYDEEYNEIDTRFNFSKKSKFGTTITSSLSNSGNTRNDKELETGYTFELSQSLYKDLLNQFYYYKKGEYKYQDYKLRIKLFEEYILKQALFAYIDYIELKNKNKEIDNSLSLIQKYIFSLKEKVNSNPIGNITLTDLAIEKNNKDLQKRTYNSILLESKAKLASFIGVKTDDVDFEDSSLLKDNPIDRYIAYQESIFAYDIAAEKIKLKFLEITVKESKNQFHPTINLFVRANSNKTSAKFFDSFNHFKDTEDKSYTIGIKSDITLFNKPNRLRILENELRLRKAKQMLNHSLIFQHNSLNTLYEQKKIQENQQKLLKQQINFLEKQIGLQYNLVENKISSTDAQQRDTDYEVQKLISLINKLEYYKLKLFNNKIKLYNKYIIDPLKRYYVKS